MNGKGCISLTTKPKVSINRIKDLIKQGEYIFTDHADQKKFEREITTNQVIGAILNGEIERRITIIPHTQELRSWGILMANRLLSSSTNLNPE